MRLWMAVTHDRLELPIAVGRTQNELALMIGTTSNCLSSLYLRQEFRHKKRQRLNYRVVMVDIPDDEYSMEDDYETERFVLELLGVKRKHDVQGMPKSTPKIRST